MENDFSGIWVPLVTPFKDQGLDLDGVGRLVRHLRAGGVRGLVVCGTTGEAATLSPAEQQQLLDHVLALCDGQLPVVFGVSSNDTRAVAARVEALADRPLAGLLVTAPYYTRPSQEGIRRHFETIAAATRLPIVIYNIPYRTGVNIELETLRQLAANPQFAAIKESGGGDMRQLAAIVEQTPLQVLCGEDEFIFLAACQGACGAIAAAAHIRPDLYARLLQLVEQGELAAAREIARVLRLLIRELFAEPNPAPLKAALAMLGLIRDELRLPMTPASAARRERLAPLLRDLAAVD